MQEAKVFIVVGTMSLEEFVRLIWFDRTTTHFSEKSEALLALIRKYRDKVSHVGYLDEFFTGEDRVVCVKMDADIDDFTPEELALLDSEE